MKSINWKVRFKNPLFYGAVAGLIAMILGDFGLDVDGYWRYAEYISYVLVTLGIISDPVVRGVADSPQAMRYDKPKDNINQRKG